MRITQNNVQFPTETIRSTEGANPGQETAISDSEKLRPEASLGIANSKDSFEEVDTTNKIDPDLKYGPCGPFPGEEWFWQDPDEGRSGLSAENFNLTQGNLILNQ
jgi:hypothetical protein